MTTPPPFGDYPPPPPPQGGGYPPPPGASIQPDNYLVWAILTTLFCCLPFGIVSIVKSSQVSTLWAQGQTAAAHKAADDARKWAIISACCGLAVSVIFLILWLAGAVAVFSTVNNIPTTTPAYPG
jgi:Interferon-induced transmembrane protein